jgi:UPF0716 protein FxsA
MGKALFLAFTVVPFVELYLLLQIGGWLGAPGTLALVVATGLVGAWLAKLEGRRVWARWREALQEGRLPEEGLVAGLLVFVGGLLLLTPGVLTDLVGLALLFPPSRRFLVGRVREAVQRRLANGTIRVVRMSTGGGVWADPPVRRPPVIDVDVEAERRG